LGIGVLMLGLDPRQFQHLRHLPRYWRERRAFLEAGGAITASFPVLADYSDPSGVARGHYFHQDLLVASLIHQANPVRHIDIGSRIDGFVAHVASFRLIEVIDVRALDDCGHPNIRFLKRDLMDPAPDMEAAADSVSCLHAIEHFGLGRYGDPLNPRGHVAGFRNIWRMVAPGGRLYIGFPIGQANEVHFNAHRVFHPHDIFSWAEDLGPDNLERFDYVDDSGRLHREVDLMAAALPVVHGCGIYTLQRPG
jgi:SAM-dependent methyltransferase